MSAYLEKIRRKSVHERKIILAVSTTVVTGIIFAVWFFNWAGGTGRINQAENSSQFAAAGIAAPSSLVKGNWQSFTETISGGFSEIKNQFRF